MKLKGKVALITGASSGIGYATAEAILEQGADLCLNFIDGADQAQKLVLKAQERGLRCLLFPVDVADETAVEQMVSSSVAELGKVDILVSSAGYSDRGPFHEVDMAGFRRTIDVLLMGTVHVLRSVAQHLIERNQGGSIIIVSSGHAHTAVPNCMAYNAAKAAVDMIAKTAAVELLAQRIRVNLVHPGWVDTPGERKYFSEAAIQEAAPNLAWGRLARPEEIARTILFLLDPDSDYITGSTLTIDGGWQLPWWCRRDTDSYV